MRAQSIGRLTLLKYCIISVLIILTIFMLTFLLFAKVKIGDGEAPVTLDNAVSILTRGFLDNSFFVAIQTGVIIVEILFLGGLMGEWIIEKRRNKFLIGGLTLLTMWLLLFLTCAMTGGIMNSIKYGRQGFTSALLSWTVYGLIPFFVSGLIHGLTAGFFLGREIKKRGVN